MTIRFTLDGREVEAAPGETIWQVATRLGTEVPHLCQLERPGYRPDGNCRACLVEVKGERVLAASCIRKPGAGMEVLTSNGRVQHARAAEVVDEAAAPGDQARVLLERYRAPDPFALWPEMRAHEPAPVVLNATTCSIARTMLT